MKIKLKVENMAVKLKWQNFWIKAEKDSEKFMAVKNECKRKLHIDINEN